MTTTSLKIDIPEEFGKFVPVAIVRLTYLYPDCDFADGDGAVVVTVNGDEQSDELKREVMHQIYRSGFTRRRSLCGGGSVAIDAGTTLNAFMFKELGEKTLLTTDLGEPTFYDSGIVDRLFRGDLQLGEREMR